MGKADGRVEQGRKGKEKYNKGLRQASTRASNTIERVRRKNLKTRKNEFNMVKGAA